MPSTEKAKKVSITLPTDMLASIKSKVKAGSYGSTSEVIREAIRLWQKQEDEHEARLDAIRGRLEQSAQSGEPAPMDEVFQRLKNKHTTIMSRSDHEEL